jgi:hypothetical protein
VSEREINQRAADEIRRAGRLNGREFRPGQGVALLDGRVVAVADDLGGALRALRALDADPARGMVLEAGPPLTDVVR